LLGDIWEKFLGEKTSFGEKTALGEEKGFSGK